MKVFLIEKLAALLVIMLLCSCSSTPVPPDSLVISEIQKNVPNYLQINSVELEAEPDLKQPGASTVKVKATALVKQNLFDPASDEELKPAHELETSRRDFSDWLDKQRRLNPPALFGTPPDRGSDPTFAHLSQKTGDSIALSCTLTAEQQGDRWNVAFQPGSLSFPIKPGEPAEVGTIGINTPEGADALSKMKAQMAVANQYQVDTQAKIDQANREFSDTVTPWLTSGKSFPGTYQDKVLGGIRVEQIRVSFDHFSPNTGKFEGKATFLTVHNAVMAFEGDVKNSSLRLHDMKVVADPMELTPDDYWVLRLDGKGDFIGTYPGGVITIHLN